MKKSKIFNVVAYFIYGVNNLKLVMVNIPYTHRDIGSETGDQRGSDGVGDGCVGTLGFLSGGGYDVKPNKGIEASGCTLHDLLGRAVYYSYKTMQFPPQCLC